MLSNFLEVGWCLCPGPSDQSIVGELLKSCIYFKFQISLSEHLEYDFQRFEMSFNIWTENQDIIEVSKSKVQSMQNLTNQSLENMLVLEEAQRSNE